MHENINIFWKGVPFGASYICGPSYLEAPVFKGSVIISLCSEYLQCLKTLSMESVH